MEETTSNVKVKKSFFKNIWFWAVVIVLVLIIFIVISMIPKDSSDTAENSGTTEVETTVVETTAAVDVDTYIGAMTEQYEQIYVAETCLAYIAAVETLYYNIYESYGSEELYESCLGVCAKSLDDFDDAESLSEFLDDCYDNITSANANIIIYGELLSYVDVSETDAEEIADVYEEVYNAYIAMYELVQDPKSKSEKKFTNKTDEYSEIIEGAEDTFNA